MRTGLRPGAGMPVFTGYVAEVLSIYGRASQWVMMPDGSCWRRSRTENGSPAGEWGSWAAAQSTDRPA